VGIGASAGGLKALEQFFTNVPADTGMAYVVVQHTSPEHKTLLGALLQRVTSLPVHDASNGLVLAPNHIYVMPTAGQLRVLHGCLQFQPTPKSCHQSLSIDIFLTSLAQDQAQHAVGVVLSGMGQDGTQGLQAIHNAGGWCLAQQPETADFDGMPKSAIDAACVDAVAPAQDMPRLIVQWAHKQSEQTTSVHPAAAEDLASIIQLLRQHLQNDFSLYKPSTLQRRVERRMHVHQLPTMADYVQYLHTNPQELDVLFSEMLIGVTSFFRDPQVWLDLANHVLPSLLGSPRTGPVRAWVLGCSTGEEAYSLAMVLREAQDQSGPSPIAVQIYASDLNPNAIAVARKGWYGAPALAHVSAQRRERFFTPHEGGFIVHPDIRAMVMFARHDVIVDPPFTHLDLLLCRNVLIYFNATLQRRLMPLFHFSLRAGGTLVLGSAETVGRSQDLFTARFSKSRIYSRTTRNVLPGSVVFPVQRHTTARHLQQELTVSSSTAPPPPNLQALADEVLLQNFSPAAVLVNASGDILYTRGRTGQYLEPAAGKANWNIHVMVRPALRTQIAMALRQALQEHQPVVLKNLPMGSDWQQPLQVTVHPLHKPDALAGMAMVVFSALTPSSARPGRGISNDAHHNEELHSAHEELQALRQEMQASKEQMLALHESMKLSNEELQSANEELTTSKEEAQSMNEELQTINSELQTRLDDLALAQSDMQNLLNSTDIATLFLDNDLNVRRYTEQAVPIFHLREADVGRPLSDLANTLDYPHLLDDVKETLRTLTPCTTSVVANDGRWFSVRIMPYRTLANMVNGAVLTFVDISTAKALEFRLRHAN
jgi:two-component system, chemotaxis family, CheB/CheR fusion protein